MRIRKPLTTLVVDWFTVRVSLADNFVCGTTEGQFEAKCTIAARDLTPEGFVIEVHDFMRKIERAFNGRDARFSGRFAHRTEVMFQGSCETIALAMVHLAHAEMPERLERCIVEVRNRTGNVEVVWERGDEVPNFLRLATAEERRATMNRQGRARRVC